MNKKPLIEVQNKYAYDIKNDPIYIDDAVSGRKGYFCMGCNKQMQAVKFTSSLRSNYFRHDATDAKLNGKCTYSDETYRHKLAKEALLMTKLIKVPAVYKYSKNALEPPNLLSSSKLIVADSAQAELYFYEDEHGNIRYTKNLREANGNLLLRPDITFFNKQGVAILFIEVVVTHKVDDLKLIKLRRLGIDAVSVTIPKSSPEEIADVFNHTRNTKWLFNYDEANTIYLPVANRTAAGIPHIDEEQRKLFTESFKCRQAHINNVIRGIGKSLESKLYRDVESGIRAEIQRVTGNAEKLRKKLEAEQDRYTNELSSIHEPIRKKYRDEERELDAEQKRYQEELTLQFAAEEGLLAESQAENTDRYAKLDARYIKRRTELAEEQRRSDDLREYLRRQISEIERAIAEQQAEFDKSIEDIVRQERDTEQSSNDFLDLQRDLRAKYLEIASEEESAYNEYLAEQINLPEEFKRAKDEEFSRFSAETANIDEQIAGEDQQRATISERFTNLEEQVRTEFEQRYRTTVDAIKRRDFREIHELSRRYNELLEGERLLINFIENQQSYSRLAKTREFIRNGEYKNWL